MGSAQPPQNPPEPAQTLESTTTLDDEFGQVSVNLAAFCPPPQRKVWTSIPRSLHRQILQQGKPTDFLQAAMEFLKEIQAVLDAAQRLDALRKAEGLPVSITGNVPDADALKVKRANEFLSKHLYKSSESFVVGGCVMLLAEKRGLV